MRILFLGAGAFGLPTLQNLVATHEVVGVVTQPDRKAGRGKSLTPTPIGAWALEHDLPVHRFADVNTPEAIETLDRLDADAWVVIAFGQKLSRKLLADRFAINLHASLLPRWRGAAPINHAILAGDTETGNSVITLADRMDAGFVLGQSRWSIEPMQTAGELHDLLASDGPALIDRVLDDFQNDRVTRAEQDESLVTIAGKLSRADGVIDWTQDAATCRNRIHGLTPWPGIQCRCEGVQFKPLRAEAADVKSEIDPGRIVDPEPGLIACGAGETLRLLEVQPAGGKPMDWASFARGRPLRAGSPVEGT